MSQQEFEQNDREVMGIVNGHAHPEAVAAAEEIAVAVTKPVADTDAERRERCSEAEKQFKKYRHKKCLYTALSVAVCLCAAAALVWALYVPSALIWVVNVGVLACGITIALKIEKFIKWWS